MPARGCGVFVDECSREWHMECSRQPMPRWSLKAAPCAAAPVLGGVAFVAGDWSWWLPACWDGKPCAFVCRPVQTSVWHCTRFCAPVNPVSTSYLCGIASGSIRGPPRFPCDQVLNICATAAASKIRVRCTCKWNHSGLRLGRKLAWGPARHEPPPNHLKKVATPQGGELTGK